MSFDWYANSWSEKQKGKFDCFSQIKLLKADTDSTNKEENKEIHKRLIQNGKLLFIEEGIKFLDNLSLKTPKINLSSFPDFSFFLQFTFELAAPYISRDDEEFYVCDNPIRKDKVFKVPLISASNWKRLNFYSTFLDKIDLEVINPHKRETKAGTMPIYIESAPCGTKGTFTLLYVPFDLLGKKEDALKKEVKEDLKLVCDSLKEMMLTYGFSAKKSSGFGIAKDKLENGNLIIKGSILPDIQSGLKTFQEPNEIFKKFMDIDGKPIAFLRDWHKEHGSEWISRQTGENTSKNKLQPFPVESFTSLANLLKKMSDSVMELEA